MNLALGSVIVFFLLTPGALFRLAYIQGPHHRGVRGSLSDEVVYSIIPAFLFQFIGIIVVEHWGFQVRLDLLFAVIIGKSSITPDEFLLMKQALPLVFAYVLIINILSIYLGAFFRRFVLHTGLDLRFNFFKVYDDWYYAIFRLKEKNKKPGTLRLYINALAKSLSLQNHVEQAYDFIWIDILTKLDKEGLIYFSGFFQEYYLNKEGNIDRIELTSVERRKFDESEEDAIELGGEVFILPYQIVSAINVNYYSIDRPEEEPDTPTQPEVKHAEGVAGDHANSSYKQLLKILKERLEEIQPSVPASKKFVFNDLIERTNYLDTHLLETGQEEVKDQIMLIERNLEDLISDIKDIIGELKKKLANEDLRKLFNSIRSEFEGSVVEEDLILLSARLSELERQELAGTIPFDEIEIKRAKIREMLLRTLSRLISVMRED